MISPLTVLPVSTVIDHKPFVPPSVDYKSLFQMQTMDKELNLKERAYDDKLREYVLNKTREDMVEMGNARLAANNIYQQEVLGRFEEETGGVIKELEQVATADKIDMVAFSKASLDYKKALTSNPDMLNVLKQQKRHAINLESIKNNEKEIDPSKVSEYLFNYSNWDGTGEDPTQTFKISNNLTYSSKIPIETIEKFNTKSVLSNGDEADILLSREDFRESARMLYDEYGKRSGRDLDTWIDDMERIYYSGANELDDGSFYRVTKRYEPKGTNPRSSKDSKDPYGRPDGYLDLNNNQWSFETGAKADSFYGGSTGDYNAEIINPGSNIEKINQFIESYNQGIAAIRTQLNSKNLLDAQGNVLAGANLTEEDKALVDQMKAYEQEKGSYDNALQKIYEEISPILEKEHTSALLFNEFTLTDRSFAINELASTTKGSKNGNDFIKKAREKFKDSPEKLEKFEKGLATAIANIATEHYAKEENISLYTTMGFYPDEKDIDYVNMVANRYKNKRGENLRLAATEGTIINPTTGKPLEIGSNEAAFLGAFVYNEHIGEFGISAVIGVPEGKDDGGLVITEGGKRAFIRDANVHSRMISQNFSEFGPRGVDLAKNLFKGFSETIDLSREVPFKIKMEDHNYEVKKTDQGYQIYVDGQLLTSEDGTRSHLTDRSQTIKAMLHHVVNKRKEETSSQGGTEPAVGKLMEPSNFLDGLAMAESSNNPIAINNSIPSYQTYATNALGKYQVVPTWHGDPIKDFVKENPELFKEDGLISYEAMLSDLSKNRDITDLENQGKKYEKEYLQAYHKFLNNEAGQDAYFNSIMEKTYLPNINKVKEAYSKKGKQLTDAEAIDLMHVHGVTGAIRATQKPRAYTQNVYPNIIPNSDTNDDQYDQYLKNNFKFQQGVSLDNVTSEIIEGSKILLSKLGLINEMELSSGYREDNNSMHGKDGKGNALDFVLPHDRRTYEDDLYVIEKIASITDDPALTKRKLLNQRGQSQINGKDIVYLNIRGKKYRVLYHKNRGTKGNHLHIDIVK